MEKIIEIKDLTVVYKDGKRQKRALDNLSLEVYKGEIFGFLGPNGAGKTTAIKALLGFIYSDSGEISIFGETSRNPMVRKKIGFMPEIANYYWYLTPVEMLRMYGEFFYVDKRKVDKRIEELLSLVELEESRNTLMKNFSKGMMQKLSFAQALINDPELLILDEPAGGLDPISRMTMRDTIRLHAEIANIYLKKKEDYRKAIVYYEKAHNLFTDKNADKYDRRGVLTFLGVCYEKTGDNLKAINIYREILKDFPDNETLKRRIEDLI